MSGPAKPKVGLLALTLELYERLMPGLREDREAWLRAALLPALSARANVLFEAACCRAYEVESAVARFEAQQVDALLIVLLTYAPSQMALSALQRTRLPLVVWNTQELHAVDSRYSMQDLRNNHGLHGTQDLANVLRRAGVNVHYITSHWRDAEGLEELHDFFVAAAAVRRLRQATIGLMGYPFPGMGDFAVDTTQMRATLGCSWVALSVQDYNRAAATADASAVAELVAEYRRAYAVAGDLTLADLEATARAELGLRRMVSEHRLDGLSYQFMAFGEDERTSTVPFVAASRLMAEGVGFGGEGDLIAAAGNCLLQWLCPPASFSEMFTMDFAGNAVLLSHMGEANVAMARRDRPVPLVARPTPITRTRDRQLALVISFEPGPATLAALTPAPSGRWQILAAPVTIEDFGPLPDLCVPHSKINPGRDLRRFLTDYALTGGPHHNAICFGDARRRLRFAAGLLQCEYREL